jgi:hypothetical protein
MSLPSNLESWFLSRRFTGHKVKVTTKDGTSYVGLPVDSTSRPKSVILSVGVNSQVSLRYRQIIDVREIAEEDQRDSTALRPHTLVDRLRRLMTVIPVNRAPRRGR